MKAAVLSSGGVGQVLAAVFLKYGHQVIQRPRRQGIIIKPQPKQTAVWEAARIISNSAPDKSALFVPDASNL
jgi:hypothetical protein